MKKRTSGNNEGTGATGRRREVWEGGGVERCSGRGDA